MLSKLIRLDSNKVYYFSKIPIKVYFVYPRIPSIRALSYLHYNQFSVGSASEEYPLTVGGFAGLGTDQFANHNGMKFSTPDNDSDQWSGYNCAASHKSGWWYHNGCYDINIDYQPPNVGRRVFFSEMKIRPKDCITQ